MIIFVLDKSKLYKAMRDIAKYLCLGLWLAEIRQINMKITECAWKAHDIQQPNE